MRKILVALAAVAVIAGAAFAAPAKDDAPKCPAGGNYALKTTPSKGHNSPVVIKGKTYYACKNCAEMLKAKAAGKKVTAKAECKDCAAAAKAKCSQCEAGAKKANTCPMGAAGKDCPMK